MRIRALILSLLLAAVLGGCTAAPAAPTAAVDHGAHGSDHAMSSDTPYDAQFIDGMIVHHQGAVTMAEQALQQAERPEIRALAQAILDAQAPEIAQMRDWRTAWYPDLAATDGMQMEMGPMAVADGAAPYDQRFLEAMIPHHEGAVAMAEDALQQAENRELRDFAAAVITAQQAEIDQMRGWLKDWYGVQP
jgi:uncharacterized protein (DUF305 family)